MDPRRTALKACLLLLVLVTAAPLRAQGPCRIAVLGDSLTAGYGVAAGASFPARLGEALRGQGLDCEVIDAGVSGDTSAGGAARLDWVLADRPTHLLVELGGNDALRTLPVEQLRRNLESIVTRARAAGVEVMLAGMLPPPNLGREYFEGFAAVYADLAEEHGIPLYPFFLDGVVFETGLMQPDGIHPNERGVEEIVRRILPTVTAWLRGGGGAAGAG
jgi:acyl-CoA thioesterase I